MSDEITLRFRRAYWALVHNLDALRLHTWEECGLTLPQLRILFYLRARPGSTTNALARTLGLTVATVSGLIDRLAQAGLVERGRRTDDRRVIPLTLTDAGQSAVGGIQHVSQAYLTALAADLEDDLESVTRAMECLVTHVERRPATGDSALEMETP